MYILTYMGRRGDELTGLGKERSYTDWTSATGMWYSEWSWAGEKVYWLDLSRRDCVVAGYEHDMWYSERKRRRDGVLT